MSNTQPGLQRGFVRLPAILRMIPIGRSTWWAGVKDGRFPKPVKLGKRTTAWRIEDIQALMSTFHVDSYAVADSSPANGEAMTDPSPAEKEVGAPQLSQWVQRLARENN